MGTISWGQPGAHADGAALGAYEKCEFIGTVLGEDVQRVLGRVDTGLEHSNAGAAGARYRVSRWCLGLGCAGGRVDQWALACIRVDPGVGFWVLTTAAGAGGPL